MTMNLFLDCLGRMHKVYYSPDDFFKEDNFGIWALPHLNFFKIMNQICFFSSIFLTPILYGKIFRFVQSSVQKKIIRAIIISRFMKKQNENVKGISEESRSKRRNRNLVTMKFNLMNWMIETFSLLLVIIFQGDDIATIIYILLNSCTTPLIYLFGLEKNQNLVMKVSKTTFIVLSVRKLKT